MRYAARRDPNHAEVVGALKAAGASVFELVPSVPGMPDLLVGYRNRTTLIEIKAPGKLSKGAKRSQERQEAWRAAWRGGMCVEVTSADEALQAVGAI